MARAKKRADGRYCAQIYLGRDENGRRQYKSVYAKSPAELKEKETAVRLQLGRGLDVLSQAAKLSRWEISSVLSATLVNIVPRLVDSSAFLLLCSLVPGATPKKPFSGFSHTLITHLQTWG